MERKEKSSNSDNKGFDISYSFLLVVIRVHSLWAASRLARGMEELMKERRTKSANAYVLCQLLPSLLLCNRLMKTWRVLPSTSQPSFPRWINMNSNIVIVGRFIEPTRRIVEAIACGTETTCRFSSYNQLYLEDARRIYSRIDRSRLI